MEDSSPSRASLPASGKRVRAGWWFARGRAKFLAIAVAVLTAALTQALTGWFTNLVGLTSSPSSEPLISYQFGERPYVVDRDLADRGNGLRDAEFYDWIQAVGGVMAGYAELVITVQGSTERAIVLTGLSVESAPREEPFIGIIVGDDGRGGDLEMRGFEATLSRDESRPEVYALTAADVPSTATGDFPFKVSATDPEVFSLTVYAEDCLCYWRVRLDWTADGKAGRTYIPELDDDLFRVTSLRPWER